MTKYLEFVKRYMGNPNHTTTKPEWGEETRLVISGDVPPYSLDCAPLKPEINYQLDLVSHLAQELGRVTLDRDRLLNENGNLGRLNDRLKSILSEASVSWPATSSDGDHADAPSQGSQNGHVSNGDAPIAAEESAEIDGDRALRISVGHEDAVKINGESVDLLPIQKFIFTKLISSDEIVSSVDIHGSNEFNHLLTDLGYLTSHPTTVFSNSMKGIERRLRKAGYNISDFIEKVPEDEAAKRRVLRFQRRTGVVLEDQTILKEGQGGPSSSTLKPALT